MNVLKGDSDELACKQKRLQFVNELLVTNTINTQVFRQIVANSWSLITNDVIDDVDAVTLSACGQLIGCKLPVLITRQH